jgi:hypothetical protein
MAKVIISQTFDTNVFNTDYNQHDIELPISWNQPANPAHLAPLNLIKQQQHLNMSSKYFATTQEESSTIPFTHNPAKRTIKYSHPITLESKRRIHPVTASTSSLLLHGNMTQTPCQRKITD